MSTHVSGFQSFFSVFCIILYCEISHQQHKGKVLDLHTFASLPNMLIFSSQIDIRTDFNQCVLIVLYCIVYLLTISRRHKSIQHKNKGKSRVFTPKNISLLVLHVD